MRYLSHIITQRVVHALVDVSKLDIGNALDIRQPNKQVGPKDCCSPPDGRHNELALSDYANCNDNVNCMRRVHGHDI